MHRLALISPFLLALLLTACGGGNGDSNGSSSGSTNGSSTTPVAGLSDAPTTAADKPTPQTGPDGVSNETVRFETSDGVTVVGHLFTSAGPRRKAVILAHEFPRDQTAWTDFATKLAASGVHALTFDFRGYGETGGELDVAKIDLDLEAAARFIDSRDYPQVYLIGASMGGTAAIKVAARLEFAGLVTISSPPAIMGLDATADVARVTEPKIFIAGSRDEGGIFVTVVNGFMTLAVDPKLRVILDESAHGTDLFGTASGPDLEAALLGFVDPD